jgi:hypothetical protein
VWSHEEKEQALHEHLLNILGSAEPRQSVINWTELQLPQLVGHHINAPFSEAEVKNAIDELPTKKAAGLDGFTSVFFRSCWDIIKPEIIVAFYCFYNQTTCPLPKLNGALLTLLPKSEIAERLGDFKLISLIHSFAKMISKDLALQQAPHINKLVSNAQSAFIRCQCIQDNYLYVRNLARDCHKKKTHALLMKLDISKAFDSVS